MKPRSMCALALALALPALGQQAEPPSLEPLVPKDAPWLQKNKKKKAPAKEEKQAEPPLSLPPLAPLTPSKTAASVGVLVQGAIPGGDAVGVGEGLRAVARRAPGVAETSLLQAPDPCPDQACWVTAGAARKVDRVLVAGYESGLLRVRLLDVKGKKQIGEAEQGFIAADPAQVTAWAEALACKLMVIAGCTGDALVVAEPGIDLAIDGQPVRSGEKRTLTVGVHALRVREGGKDSSRALPVLIESSPPVTIAATRAAPAAAVSAAPLPQEKRTWTKTAGYVAGGAAVVALAAGAYFGLKSKSDIDAAESAYHANGDAWKPADLDTLNSGNSKAHTANALFIASGVLLAAGAALTFAF